MSNLSLRDKPCEANFAPARHLRKPTQEDRVVQEALRVCEANTAQTLESIFELYFVKPLKQRLISWQQTSVFALNTHASTLSEI
jgi:hypothetical protein